MRRTPREIVSARFAKAEVSELKRLAAETGLSRSEVLRQSLRYGGPIVAAQSQEGRHAETTD
jgi:hypothetical protein